MIETPHKVSASLDAIGKVLEKEGEAIPSPKGEPISDKRGLQEMRWSIEPIQDL